MSDWHFFPPRIQADIYHNLSLKTRQIVHADISSMQVQLLVSAAFLPDYDVKYEGKPRSCYLFHQTWSDVVLNSYPFRMPKCWDVWDLCIDDMLNSSGYV